MTSENNDKRLQQKASKALDTVTSTAQKVQRNPVIAHLLRAAERFNDRMGNQFGAAITYFSFLSMIPILMVSFAAAGFILASHPTLLQDIFKPILATAGMGLAVYLMMPHVASGEYSRLMTIGVILIAVVLYVFFVFLFGAINQEDMEYLPGGKKITSAMIRLKIWKAK